MMKPTALNWGYIKWILQLWILTLTHNAGKCMASVSEERGPVFEIEPAGEVAFANTKGAQLQCTATGTPNPHIVWGLSDGSPVFPLPGLRELDSNKGILILKPFSAEQYRPDVHSVIYRCVANNSVGRILSTGVHVRGVVLQSYDVQVYDSFAIEGNTALFKCHIPAVLADFITVSGWIKNDKQLITPSDSVMADKYTVTPGGELHIAEVEVSDSNSVYKCKTIHKLSGESHVSKSGGRLFVTVPHGNVPTKIIDLVTEIKVAVNGLAVIPCVAQGFPVPNVKWYRKQHNGKVTEILDSSRYKIAKSTLEIGNVQISDHGSYICEASSSLGKDEAEILLLVKEPVQVDISPKLLTSKIKESITFNCNLTGGSARTFTWLHNGEIVPHAYESSLRKSVVDGSDGGMYQCVTEFDKKTFQATAELRLSGIPPKLVNVFHDVVLQPGEKITLECSAMGTPIPSFSWDVDGISLASSEGIEVTNVNDNDGKIRSSLLIPYARAEDGGLYTCTAESREGSSASSARVNIFGPIQRRVAPSKMAVAGTDIYLNCPYYGYPAGEIQWHFDDMRLPTMVKQLPFKNGTLFISDVQKPSDVGLYKCYIKTIDGQHVQSELQLQIVVAPKVVPFWFQEELLREGMRARLQCVVSVGDLPLTITWLKDGQPLSQLAAGLSINVRVLDDFSSILTIGSINPRHNGNYTCVASNMAASNSYTAQLAVSVAPKIVPFAFQDVHFEGSTTRLVCGLLEGDLPVQFLWLKNDLPLDISLYEGSLTVHNVEGVSSILTLKNIEAEHAGNYTCVATNRVASAKHSVVLVVNVAPKIVPFSFQGDHMFEGAVARVTCVVYQGDLPLTMEWLKDGDLVVAGFSGADVRQLDEYTSILTIDNVNARHAGNYTCIAKNRAEAASYSAILSVNVPPKIVPFAFQEDHLIEGNLARVSCIISRGDLPLNIRWEKDGEAIRENVGVAVRSFDEHSSILTIQSVDARHNGRYACVASNAAGVANYSAEILVQVPPHWVLKPENAAVALGQDVMMHCKADGYPMPIISWKHSRDDLPHIRDDIAPNEKYYLHMNGSLLIRKVQKDDAGNYFCLASNGVKGAISTTNTLRIKAPPTFQQSTQNVFAKTGKEFKLKCDGEGDEPIRITWYKDGEEIPQESAPEKYNIHATSSTFGLSSVLTLFNTGREDNGNYVCKASNDHGFNSMTYVVLVEELPEPPKDIAISVHGSRMMELSWQKPFDGNVPITKFTIEYIAEFEDWENVISLDTASGAILTGIVANLKPATSYLFRMYTENAMGKSKSSPILKGSTIGEAPSSVPKTIQVTTNNDNMLTVTWGAPEDLFQSRIVGFYVGFKEYGNDEGYTFKTVLLSDSQRSEYTFHLTSLKKFTKYMVVVQAYNQQGKGPLSDPIIAMTSEGVPNASPLNVRCTTLTSQSIHVAWAPPPSNAVNGILRNYKVTYKTSRGWYEDEVHTLNCTAASATLKDLEKYTNYTIQVSAATKFGEGPDSYPIACKTLDDVPDAPADVKVIAVSENAVLLTWRQPPKPNGIIKSYNTYFRDAALRNDVTRNSLPAKLTQIEIPALQKGKRYEFWVTASTLVGEGGNSPIVAVTLNSASVPARIVPFDEKVIVPWKSDISLSCEAVGIPLPDRKWYFRDEDVIENDRINISPEGSLTIKGVREEDIGDYYCVVSNELNEDRVTYTVIVLVPPSPPTAEVIHSSSNSIEIRWRMNHIGSDSVKGYILHVRRGFGEWEEISLDPDVTSYRLNGLECGTNYEIAMAAFSKIGLGDKSKPLLVPTNGSVPGVPAKKDLIEETATSISISLNAWKVHGCPILYYIIEYKQKDTEEWTFASKNAKPEQMRLVIRDLTPATWYRLRITAHSGAGSSVAEYDFATVTISGATISPDLMLQDQYLNASSSTQVDLWVVIVIILSLLLLVVGIALVSLFLKRKHSGQGDANAKGHRLSTASSGLAHDGNSSRYSYSHRGKMNRPQTDFCTMSSAGCQDDPTPYATCQLDNQTFATLPRHGMCPPIPIRQIEMTGNFEVQNRMMLDNGSLIHLGNGPAETTFIFPNVHGANGCFPNTSFGHIHEDPKQK